MGHPSGPERAGEQLVLLELTWSVVELMTAPSWSWRAATGVLPARAMQGSAAR